MSFDEVRLPEDVERGAQGGPVFSTTVIELSNGAEKRNQNWSLSRAEYDVGYGIQKRSDFDSVLSFFYARRGKARGFRFKDWSDYEATDENFGTGDGATTVFYLTKTYTDGGGNTYERGITKPVDNSAFKIYDDGVEQTEGVDYTVDYTLGKITFAVAPTLSNALTWSGEFDVPVRFDTDALPIDIEHYDALGASGITIIELRIATS